GVVAMDGKATAGDGWDMHYAQKQTHSSDGGASGVVRTITCCLVSAPAVQPRTWLTVQRRDMVVRRDWAAHS
ncbi:MAG TPA: hypothetical protein VGQ83_27430, partial [Polyangia bacterium]